MTMFKSILKLITRKSRDPFAGFASTEAIVNAIRGAK